MTLDIHRQLAGNQARRMAAEDRYLERMERRELAAERQIGELVREGRQLLYIWPQGGKYREGTRIDLVAFLIRNHYA
ncbi:hypothetical protein ACGLHS_31965 [Variovorax sp. VaC1]|uniref:hypothetical protein n=1 Tax=Variovorax sp. VaC1 TaxID=3373132 RepID=UPI0037487D0D